MTAGPPPAPAIPPAPPPAGPGEPIGSLSAPQATPPPPPQSLTEPGRAPARPGWPLWEVFVRARRGLSHQHVGSLHAPDAAMALRNARDVYTRRGEGVSIWVVPAAAITASSPDEKDPFFDPALDKAYRHPTFYDVPEGVSQL